MKTVPIESSSQAASPITTPPGEGPVQTCDCCPYGYHIDRDFVRFCENYRTEDGQIFQRTVKSRLVLPWDDPNDLQQGSEGSEEEAPIEVDGEIAYMHVERVVTETLEDHEQLGQYYQWSSDVSLPVMQKLRTVHESRQEEEGMVNLHHTEHATYEMKAPGPPPKETIDCGIETDEVYLRNAGCQAEILIEVPKRDACTAVCVDQRSRGVSAVTCNSTTGFGSGDVRDYKPTPVLRSVGCGDTVRMRDHCHGSNRVDELPYIDVETRVNCAQYGSDAPWVKQHCTASMMAGPSFFRGFSDRGLQADLLPKPPRMCNASTQFDKSWATSERCVGEEIPTNNASCQAQPDVSSRTVPNAWPDIRPTTYEIACEACIDPDFIEKETRETSFANSFETILRAIYEHQIVNKEEVLMWLQEALHKDLNTVECQTDFERIPEPRPRPPATTGCQTTQSSSCWNDSASNRLKNHATQVRPKMCDSGSWTDRAVCVSASTCTDLVDRHNKQTITQPAITYTVGTSTEQSWRDDSDEFSHRSPRPRPCPAPQPPPPPKCTEIPVR